MFTEIREKVSEKVVKARDWMVDNPFEAGTIVMGAQVMLMAWCYMSGWNRACKICETVTGAYEYGKKEGLGISQNQK